MSFRSIVAVVVAKIAILALRLSGRGGSTLPGRIARGISPHVLEELGRRHSRGNVVISGTNGKTTTAKMISVIVSKAGFRPAHNRTGANLIYGIISEFARQASLYGAMPADIGLAEVDEATMPAVCRELRPEVAVVTNFFRDQLDRYGELETTVSLVRKGIQAMPEGAVAVLNADDPFAAGLAEGTQLRTIFFGIDDPSLGHEERAQVADIKRCPVCGSEYEYDAVYYAHLGSYRCPSCGRSRPDLHVRLVSYEPRGARGSRLGIVAPEGRLEVSLRIPGIYNAYNALAATACGLVLGVPLTIINEALEEFTSSFGRMELIEIGAKSAFIALVKNPTGFNEVIRTLLEGEERKRLVIAINDRYADGRDVSWLWDVDFERLAGRQQSIDFVVASGIRAQDMAVRLKYAGLDQRLIRVTGDLGRAIRAGLDATPEGEVLYVLPTYTAMLEIRDVFRAMGYARPFWEV
ncbi:MAG: Mur ligase family protein [Bacillota bacterium]|nr:Mur ligase family protein [Bacillota bacterium]